MQIINKGLYNALFSTRRSHGMGDLWYGEERLLLRNLPRVEKSGEGGVAPELSLLSGGLIHSLWYGIGLGGLGRVWCKLASELASPSFPFCLETWNSPGMASDSAELPATHTRTRAHKAVVYVSSPKNRTMARSQVSIWGSLASTWFWDPENFQISPNFLQNPDNLIRFLIDFWRFLKKSRKDQSEAMLPKFWLTTLVVWLTQESQRSHNSWIESGGLLS